MYVDKVVVEKKFFREPYWRSRKVKNMTSQMSAHIVMKIKKKKQKAFFSFILYMRIRLYHKNGECFIPLFGSQL